LFPFLLTSLSVKPKKPYFGEPQQRDKQAYVFLVPPSNNKRKMHLWPTMRIRESFKISYLKKYDWNLQRMNSEKKRQSQEANDNSNQQRLLDDAGENSTNQQKPANNSKAVLICREILMVITCCYCCFCFGGKVLIFLPFLVYLVCVCVCVLRARVWIVVCLSGFLFIYELNLWGLILRITSLLLCDSLELKFEDLSVPLIYSMRY
jgi:hypothetical protein